MTADRDDSSWHDHVFSQCLVYRMPGYEYILRSVVGSGIHSNSTKPAGQDLRKELLNNIAGSKYTLTSE